MPLHTYITASRFEPVCAWTTPSDIEDGIRRWRRELRRCSFCHSHRRFRYMRRTIARRLFPVKSLLHPVVLTSFPSTRLGLPNVLGTSFPFPRHRFRSRTPECRRVLLVPHQLHPRGCRHRIGVLREVRIRAGLFRQEHLRRRALRKPIHPHGMGLYPIPEEIMNVFPCCCRF